MKKSWRCILLWTLFHCITRWSNFHSLFYFSWILSPFPRIEASPMCTPLFMQLTLLSLVYTFPLAGASLDSVCLTFTLSFLTTLISFETLASWALVVQEDCESEGVFSLVFFFFLFLFGVFFELEHAYCYKLWWLSVAHTGHTTYQMLWILPSIFKNLFFSKVWGLKYVLNQDYT